MSLTCEGLSLVIRNVSINTRYKGGYRIFLHEIANSPHETDGQITKLDFLSDPELKSKIYLLQKRGLIYLNEKSGKAVDMTVVSGFWGLRDKCDWLIEDQVVGMPLVEGHRRIRLK
jgi:hypothetical protein